MIIDRIDPIALRIPARGGNTLCLTACRVVTKDGLEGAWWGIPGEGKKHRETMTWLRR